MKCRIIFARTAERELARLSSDAQLRIGRAIRSLEDDPISASTKRLKGRKEFRLRVGDYRVLYWLEHENRVLTIVAIGHRRDVYR
ncbi:MAG: type II toxin-antitoxin system mRNA interferase toxin, RelE/StbE family [Verrucomicrobia bacterium]|nr:MAG: type II toxin-antitoxin system mRNA interferase toxin, RelE/StbE family [Verrucomicrobiota bacterium]PYK92532.1 MAG: type II toxin-antitoxin system mRNA interferase toxin, RelE/StbE family [Verrucomicrobiota bacterium]